MFEQKKLGLLKSWKGYWITLSLRNPHEIMNILVTGGSGFIASHLIDKLLDRGDKVLSIDNYKTGRRDNLRRRDGLSILQGNVYDEKFMQTLFDDFKPEIVVHAAASYKDPDNYEEDIRTNALGTAITIQQSERIKVKRFIYFQTALCYGSSQEKIISIDHPINPYSSSYALSKTIGEDYLRMSSLDYISFRLANIYGPRNITGPIPTFFQRLSQNKACFVVNTRRDFVYIQDLLSLVIKAIAGRGNCGIYHVSSGKDHSIQEVFDLVLQELGLKREVEIRAHGADDVASLLLDPTKTKENFDWEVKKTLREGLKEAMDYYRKFGVTETYSRLRYKL